jgi:calcineurin-like phosphoesterase family protein
MKYATPVIKKNQPDDSYKYRPVPKPKGGYPYRLLLSDVMPEVSEDELIFHMAGDTGSVRRHERQQGVIDAMVSQYQAAGRPAFLYHLGDIVYHYGEESQYQQQFFKPFENYPAPIFAIAGNHDSDVNPDSAATYQSLDAFAKVFCTGAPQIIAFSGNSTRKSMVQPHIYWTLNTPLATIIGMHSNVPKYGIVDADQHAWLVNELRAADTNKMLILCVHHALYSADINHGASLYMIALLEEAYREAGIRPDAVFSGHVHNYQRFSKSYADGTQTPYIVAGAGGFDELHSVADTSDQMFTPHSPLFDGVALENYCDDQHGFLKITLTRQNGGVKLAGEYYATGRAEAVDSFTVFKG